jgi:hypothetical protein
MEIKHKFQLPEDRRLSGDYQLQFLLENNGDYIACYYVFCTLS